MNVLLIMPKFFGYEKKIKSELKKRGCSCDVIFENIEENSIVNRLIIRCMPNKKRRIFDFYYKLNLSNKTYHKILIIRGSTITSNTIELIKKHSPNAKIYMYQWDSVKNNPNAELLSAQCDYVATFDKEDSILFGWRYLPLFYISESNRIGKRDIDIAYICTLHSQRVKAYKYLMKKFYDKKCFLYMFSQPMHFLKQKYIIKNADFDGINRLDIKFQPLNLNKTQQIMSKSNIIVDYTHPSQSGFTMRTIESIGHKCKLITNNKNVRNADFYHPNNVFIYSIDDMSIPDEFVNSEYVMLEDTIYKKYSISSWIDTILNI